MINSVFFVQIPETDRRKIVIAKKVNQLESSKCIEPRMHMPGEPLGVRALSQRVFQRLRRASVL